MQKFLLIISLILSCNVGAQKSIQLNKTFLRVYVLAENKLNKGKIVAISEGTLVLERDRKTVAIPTTSIGSIKTNRTKGRYFFLGSAIGMASGALIGTATYKNTGFLSFPQRPHFAFGGGIGLFVGGLIGETSRGSNNSEHSTIIGGPERWKTFVEIVGVDAN